MKEKMKKQMPALIGPVLMLAGICCIFAAIGIGMLDYYNEQALTDTLETLIAKKAGEGDVLEQEEQNTADHTAVASVSDSNEKEASMREPVGVMEIPAIGMKASIVEGSDTKALKNALGHLQDTAPIGADFGNCVVAGHRNYTFGRFFNRLDEVTVGDRVTITEINGNVCQYIVKNITVVEPEEVTVLADTEEPVLTLVTCTPIYIASHRLIVTCTKAE